MTNRFELLEDIENIYENVFSQKELDFIYDIHSIPLIHQSVGILENIMSLYLEYYISDKDYIENMIPFCEFVDYVNNMKSLIEEKDDDLSKVEYTDEELLNNGFIKTEFVVHEHNAQRAKLHWDLRFKTEYGKYAYSFAIPKAKFPEYNEKVLALKQPMHPAVWVDLKSTNIEEGYGRGSVITIDRGEVFYKIKNKMFVLYMKGEKIIGPYYLLQFDNNNQYLLVKSKTTILSDYDSLKKEFIQNAFRHVERLRSKVSFMLNIDSINNINVTTNIDQQNDSLIYIHEYNDEFWNKFKSFVIECGVKDNPTKDQVLNCFISYNIGIFAWTKMDEKVKDNIIKFMQDINFVAPKQIDGKNIQYNHYLFSVIMMNVLNGKKIINGMNSEVIFRSIIGDKKEYFKREKKVDIQDEYKDSIQKE